jgi:hypothetical protein
MVFLRYRKFFSSFFAALIIFWYAIMIEAFGRQGYYTDPTVDSHLFEYSGIENVSLRSYSYFGGIVKLLGFIFAVFDQFKYLSLPVQTFKTLANNVDFTAAG